MPRPPADANSEGAPSPADARPLDRFLRPYFTDPALGPVLVVFTATLVVFGASALLLALGSRSVFAIAAVLLLAAVTTESLWRDLRRRRLGAANLYILVVWVLSALAAGAAVYFDVV